MTKKTLTLILAASMAFAVACGDDADPSKNSATNVSTNSNTSSNSTTPANNSTTPANNSTTTTPTNNGTTPTNNMNTGTCDDPLPDFFGQIGSDEVAGGGAPDTGGTYDVDAGLQAVFDAVPAEEGALALDPPLRVEGALVNSTGFVPSGADGPFRYFLEDANATIEVYYPNDETYTPPATSIATGMVISFDVVEVANFGGSSPQISKIENLTVDAEGQQIPVIEGSTRALTPADLGRIVKIGGQLPDVAGESCGGTSNCWDLDYGNGTIILRSGFAEPGDCVTFVGPLRSFPGPLSANLTAANLQADVIQFDWALIFGPGQ